MYARKNNDKIEVFASLPNIWKNYINFPKIENEILKQEGFYPLLMPELPKNKQYGNVLFNEKEECFYYEMIDINKIWHEEKPIQLIISEEQKKDWLLKNAENDILGNYPEIALLLNYVKNLKTIINEAGSLYIYLEEIFPEHKLLLEKMGVIINYS